MSDDSKRMLTLKSVTINKYKSIETEQKFEVEPDVTVLVGKNESGKTAILEALAKSNPYPGQQLILNAQHDYPIDQYSHITDVDRERTGIKCKYTLGDNLLEHIFSDMGERTILERELQSDTSYSDPTQSQYYMHVDDDQFVRSLAQKHTLNAADTQTALATITYEGDLYSIAKESLSSNLKALYQEAIERLGEYEDPHFRILQYLIDKWLKPSAPRFLYYSDYYQLPSEIDLYALQNDRSDRLELKTAKALFDLANLAPQDLLSSNDEANIRALESAGRQVSATLGEYWHTNKNLRVRFHKPGGANAHGNPYVKVRISDGPDSMTLPLDSRSRGFRWFFSFFVWFSKIQEDSESHYILLLDEPGLTLHASAQQDLLRFIEDLSKDYQIIYTTHSQFMIDTEKQHRIRTVAQTKNGTQILDRLKEKDSETLLPLQAALGYDIFSEHLYWSQ